MFMMPDPFELLDEIDYEEAAFRGGTKPRKLPILVARGAALPAGLEGLMLTSDLQGMEPLASVPQPRPLANLVLDRLGSAAGRGLLPAPARMGAILAGDLYATPGLVARGVSGPVDQVWLDFAAEFRWVAGVLGNHDQLAQPSALASTPNLHLLDGESVDCDGLRIAGVGGIMGRPTKLNRKTPEDFLGLVRRCAAQDPDLLVLHEGPGLELRGFKGSVELRQTLEECGPRQVVSGHCHWPDARARISERTRVLNVDARVVVVVG